MQRRSQEPQGARTLCNSRPLASRAAAVALECSSSQLPRWHPGIRHLCFLRPRRFLWQPEADSDLRRDAGKCRKGRVSESLACWTRALKPGKGRAAEQAGRQQQLSRLAMRKMPAPLTRRGKRKKRTAVSHTTRTSVRLPCDLCIDLGTATVA